MNFIILAVLVIFILIIAFKLKANPHTDIESFEHSYDKLDVLFTPAERSFYGVLNQSINDDVIVFGKVRVADVITPRKGGVKGAWQKAFNKISAKHFDFVLCNKSDLSFICSIELDDKSHNSPKQKSRDAFIESACKSADFRLIRFPAKSTYSISDIQESLKVCFPDLQNTEELMVELEPVENGKTCPKCSSEMTIKTARKGKSAGNDFWGCMAFPKCRHIEPVNE